MVWAVPSPEPFERAGQAFEACAAAADSFIYNDPGGAWNVWWGDAWEQAVFAAMVGSETNPGLWLPVEMAPAAVVGEGRDDCDRWTFHGLDVAGSTVGGQAVVTEKHRKGESAHPVGQATLDHERPDTDQRACAWHAPCSVAGVRR